MTPTRLLHMLLLLTLVMLLIVIVRVQLNQNDAVRLVPPPISTVPMIPLAPAKVGPPKTNNIPVPGRFVFPAPFERFYVAMPLLWERQPTEVALAEGDIKTAPAPVKTPHAKQIPAAPTVVKLPWVFALP